MWATIILVIAGVLAFFILFRFYFLRNPVRVPPKGDVIVSPANGKVVRVIKFSEENVLSIRKGSVTLKHLVSDVAKKGYCIVIMMTPLNVHYQRSPLAGKVISTLHKEGKFLNAVRGASSLSALENERNEILVSTKIGNIKVIQVAGFVARRISCFVKKEQKIDIADTIGLISFGSQCLLVLPDVRISVKEGETVIDGESVIARY